MRKVVKKIARVGAIILLAATVASCEPNVYGSVGYSSWGGYGGGMGGSISVGGRICC